MPHGQKFWRKRPSSRQQSRGWKKQSSASRPPVRCSPTLARNLLGWRPLLRGARRRCHRQTPIWSVECKRCWTFWHNQDRCPHRWPRQRSKWATPWLVASPCTPFATRRDRSLSVEVRRRLGRHRACPTPSDASGVDDSEEDLPQEMDDAEGPERGVKRGAETVDEDPDSLSAEELEARLWRCQRDHAEALQERNWDQANALSGTMFKLVQALESRTGGAAQSSGG